MDCNKEEATKLLDLSEKKFKSNDIEGAIKLAQKAQRLFPNLQNIQHTITAYEVHLAASKAGPTDWHAVLRVEPSADYSTLRKQFKNMCLLTHPDKNMRSSAADGAFKFVMKAWSILSSTKPSTSSSTTSSNAAKPKKKKEESSSNAAKPKKKKEEKKAPNWEYLFSKIRCQSCELLHFWDFSRMDSKSLHHYCKNCSTWCEVRSQSANADVPLSCEGCDCNLSWGSYRPFGYECSNCGCYYVVGVDPNWIPKSRDKGNDASFRPGTVSCPFCGAWSDYVVDESNKCYVRCKQCGLRSVIELEKAD